MFQFTGISKRILKNIVEERKEKGSERKEKKKKGATIVLRKRSARRPSDGTRFAKIATVLRRTDVRHYSINSHTRFGKSRLDPGETLERCSQRGGEPALSFRETPFLLAETPGNRPERLRDPEVPETSWRALRPGHPLPFVILHRRRPSSPRYEVAPRHERISFAGNVRATRSNSFQANSSKRTVSFRTAIRTAGEKPGHSRASFEGG